MFAFPLLMALLQVSKITTGSKLFYYTDGTDYTNTVTELTFNATATSYDVLVPINQDGELEGNEKYRAELQVIENTNNIGLTVDPATAVVTIARNAV